MLNAEVRDTLDVATVTDSRNAAVSSSAPLQRVQASALQTEGVASLHEALRAFAGVSVKDYGGIGGMKTVSIRSFGAQHTGVCYDGVTISDAQNGQVDIGRFNIDNMQSVSVETAGSDDIFRSARLNSYAGVLIMKSRRPDFRNGPAGVSARMRFASFGTYNPYLNAEARLGRNWSGTFSANYMDSKGEYPFILRNGDLSCREIRLNSAVRSLASEINVYGTSGRGGDLAFKLSCYGSSRGLPGSVVLYYQNPTEHLWDSNVMASASYERTFQGRCRLKTDIVYTNSGNRYTNTDMAYPEPLDDRYMQNELAASAVALWTPAAGTEISFAEDITAGHLESGLADCVHPSRFVSYSAVAAKYAAARFKVTGGTLITCAADLTREAGSGHAASGRAHLSPWLSASVRIASVTGLRLRASLKDSYRMPSFNDMYYPRVGGRDLKPEKALQSNLGLVWEHRFAGIVRDGAGHLAAISADAYYNRVRDKIVARPSMFIWTMRNVGEVEMAGCDLTASYSGSFAAWIGLRAHAAYSFRYAVDITDPESACYRHQIAYTPRHCGSASASVETPWVNVCYSVNAVGRRYSLAQNLPEYGIDPYADHCLSVNGGFRFGRRHVWMLHWSAEALNLAGTNYEVIKYYPMPGRNYRITIKITY